MNIPKNLYPSVACNWLRLRQTIVGVQSEDAYGYALVGDQLVSFEFIDGVKEHVRFNPLLYGPIIDAKSMVDADYWDGLDIDERELIGPCLLILIGNGELMMRKQNCDVPTI